MCSNMSEIGSHTRLDKIDIKWGSGNGYGENDEG